MKKLFLLFACAYAISTHAMHDINQQFAITMRECDELLSRLTIGGLEEKVRDEIDKRYNKTCKLVLQLEKTIRLKAEKELLELNPTFDNLVNAIENRIAMEYYLFPISPVQREQLLNRAKAIFEEDQQYYRQSKQVLENLECPSKRLNLETLKEEYASAIQESENLQRELEEIKGHYKMATSSHQSSNSTSNSDEKRSGRSYNME